MFETKGHGIITCISLSILSRDSIVICLEDLLSELKVSRGMRLNIEFTNML